jgi:RNA recognition motif-containing protein
MHRDHQGAAEGVMQDHIDNAAIDRPRPRARGRRTDQFRGNVFVANLPRGVTDEQLAQAFDQFGFVVGAFVARDPVTRSPMTYGLVDLAPAAAAAEAVAALNGTKIAGRTVEVRLSDPTQYLTIPMPPRAAHGPSAHAPSVHAGSAATTSYYRPAMPARTMAPRKPVQVEYRSIARRS